jgi:hypothetical protein
VVDVEEPSVLVTVTTVKPEGLVVVHVFFCASVTHVLVSPSGFLVVSVVSLPSALTLTVVTVQLTPTHLVVTVEVDPSAFVVFTVLSPFAFVVVHTSTFVEAFLLQTFWVPSVLTVVVTVLPLASVTTVLVLPSEVPVVVQVSTLFSVLQTLVSPELVSSVVTVTTPPTVVSVVTVLPFVYCVTHVVVPLPAVVQVGPCAMLLFDGGAVVELVHLFWAALVLQ